MRAIAPFAALPLIVAAVPAFAVDEVDRGAIQTVIRSQLEAFQADDAEGAYGYAAPSIRRMFPGPGVFIDMVRRGYPPVYRPKAYAFGETKDGQFGPTQSVRITDAQGTDWVALYTMERQEDGTWRISGCVLVKDEAKSV